MEHSTVVIFCIGVAVYVLLTFSRCVQIIYQRLRWEPRPAMLLRADFESFCQSLPIKDDRARGVYAIALGNGEYIEVAERHGWVAKLKTPPGSIGIAYLRPSDHRKALLPTWERELKRKTLAIALWSGLGVLMMLLEMS